MGLTKIAPHSYACYVHLFVKLALQIQLTVLLVVYLLEELFYF